MSATGTGSKRKRIKIVQITVDGVEVDAKECSKCGEVKVLTDYGADGRNSDGRRSRCRKCVSKENQSYYGADPERHRIRMRNHYAMNSEKYRERQLIYNAENREKKNRRKREYYAVNKEQERERRRENRAANLVKVRAWERTYRETNKEKIREQRRKRREANPEKFREYDRKRYVVKREMERDRRRVYYVNNSEKVRKRVRKYRADYPEKVRAIERRRRAMKWELPSAWTVGQEAQYSNETCSLSQSSGENHVDHVIPLAWGHGGSYVGNMIPLSSTLNISKSDGHFYEWFETNRQRFKLDQSRFDAVVADLANQNGLTPDEYRQYVDWCFANKRSLDDIIADNKRFGYVVTSVELWRDSTGMQLPLRFDNREQTYEAEEAV